MPRSGVKLPREYVIILEGNLHSTLIAWFTMPMLNFDLPQINIVNRLRLVAHWNVLLYFRLRPVHLADTNRDSSGRRCLALKGLYSFLAFVVPRWALNPKSEVST